MDMADENLQSKRPRRNRKRNKPQDEGGSARAENDSGIARSPSDLNFQESNGSGEQFQSESLVPTPDFFRREMSWLEFNRRVLHEAMDIRTPLLERVRFLAIFTSNLDEFYMKRMGSLKRRVLAGQRNARYDVQAALDLIKIIREQVKGLLQMQAKTYKEEILPLLVKNGVHLLSWTSLTAEEQLRANQYFRDNVFPALTPLAVDPGHPFPFLSNLSTSLAVWMTHPDRDERLFARVKVPKVFPRWIQLSTDEFKGQYRFISLNELIEQNLGQLFPSMKLLGVVPFRITRNANIERDEEEADDLLEMIEEELRQRRFAQIVRLEYLKNTDPGTLQFLIDELELTEDDVFEMPAELDFTDLLKIADLNIPTLKFEPWSPVVPQALTDEESSIFSVIRAGDILVHHPYESFTASVERFIQTAVDDPRVVAIKMSLYRTGDSSPFISALIRAAELGKQVVCLIELKARFDEERNINWAQALEAAGVHVVYGVVGLKTHAKIALVVRQENEGLRSYAHIGTGNYHTGTARLYTDVGLLTCRKEIIEDVVELFHYLTGRSLKTDYRKLLVAPVTMKDRFLQMIDREVQQKRDGKPAHIVVKINAFDNPAIGRALYRASQEGVEIDMIVRGFCCLKPRVPFLSERIRVISVIGRFLEHARIFYFRNGAEVPVQGDFYIGSADWMDRNLLGRVEAAVPIDEAGLKERLWEMLQIQLRDQRQAWDLMSDGTYVQRQPRNEDEALGTHQTLMRLHRRRSLAGE